MASGNGTKPLRFSVLDQSPISEGGTGAQALKNTLELARRTEELGFGRYWLAEHHATPMLAAAAPEVLIAAVGAVTDRMRVGSGGVMISHYSPFKVAEVFSILGGLYGKRIDLGVGRAPGADLETIAALQRDRRQQLPDDFPEQVAELICWLEDNFPPGHSYNRLAKLPGAPGTAEVWMLGTSQQTADWAAELGLPYSVAAFIRPDCAPVARSYRERFQPSHRLKHPELMVAVGVLCAETDEEAIRLASSWSMAVTLANKGLFGSVATVSRALEFLEREETLDPFAGRHIVAGSPDTVRAVLLDMAEEFGADELMIHTVVHSHAARVRSYELLAEVFELGDAQAPRRKPARKRR